MALFPKNSGEVLTSVYKGLRQVFPERWLAKLHFTVDKLRVDNSVEPTAPTGNIVAESVEAEQTGERWHTIITLDNPTDDIVEKIMVDGLSGTRTRSIIDEGATLPELTFKTIQAEQTAFGNNKSELQILEVPNYLVRTGQDLEVDTGAKIRYTREIKALGSNVGDDGVKSTPLDHLRSEVETLVLDTSALNNFFASVPDMVSVNVPSELLDVETYWSESTAAGTSLTASDSSASISDGISTIQVPAKNDNSGSSSLIPTLKPIIQKRNGDNIPCRTCIVYMASGSSIAQLMTKLGTNLGELVQSWPNFATKTHTLILKGQKVSCRADVDLYLNRAESTSGTEAVSRVSTAGTSYDLSDSVREMTIGPVINGTINIAEATKTVAASAEAYSVIDGTYGFDNTATAEYSLTAEISPDVLLATPITEVPTSGLYATAIRPRPFRPGWFFIQVSVFDAAEIN